MTPRKDKTLIGQLERVILHSEGGKRTLIARIDTGARWSSIDVKLAAKLRLGPIIEARAITSSHGSSMRPVVKAKVTLTGRTINGRFTVYDRRRMKQPVLIGRNILKGKFIIDPSKNR